MKLLSTSLAAGLLAIAPAAQSIAQTATPAPTPDRQQTTTATSRPTAESMAENRKSGKIIAADELLGTSVYFRDDDEDIGNVHKLLIDKGEHRVAYGVVSVGDWLDDDRGDRLEVSWKMLRQSTEEDRAGFVLNANREQISKAPAFDEDDEPDFGDDEWNREVHMHYGLPWTDRPRTVN